MAFFTKKRKEKIQIEEILSKPLPNHIAIIMDGNGRWAQKKGLPRGAGHRAGVEALKKIVEFCGEINIPYLTVYAFSTENWKRPKEEINTLMHLMVEYIQKEINILIKKGVRVNPIGNVEELPPFTFEHIQKAALQTKNNNKLVLNVALNYGGRREITQAVQKIAGLVQKGEVNLENINEELISEYLYTGGQPDPDLMIRPSGEMRLSNFLLWQVAYSELWVTDIMWPDFKPKHLIEAIFDYQRRNRRYGGLNN